MWVASLPSIAGIDMEQDVEVVIAGFGVTLIIPVDADIVNR
jgi:hypothetical protein